jgi:hypothetical protein
LRSTNWKKPAYLDTMATAYAENSQLDEAIKYKLKALESKPDAEDRKRMEERLALHRQQRPYGEAPQLPPK